MSRRKLILAAALIATAMLCAWATALPTGGWVLTPDLECEDSALVCAEWEFEGGGRTDACCVTMGDFTANRPTCTSTNYR